MEPLTTETGSMSTPLVTIGIPTFNRAGSFVKETLTSALEQSYQNLEIVVSDNASTDNTCELVESLGKGRTKYFRNPENIGAFGNFSKVLEYATGKYFSWLQDDDLIFRDFISQAVAALETHPEAVAYCAYAFTSPHTKMLNDNLFIYGPPFPLDWVASATKEVSGDLVTLAATFLSVAVPPVIVFRRSELTQSLLSMCLNEQLSVYSERVFLSRLAIGKKILLAPVMSGIHRLHANQFNSRLVSDRKRLAIAAIYAGDCLDEIWGQRNVNACEEFQILLENLPDRRIIMCFDQGISLVGRRSQNRLCTQVAAMIISEIERRKISGQLRIRMFRRTFELFLERWFPWLFRKLHHALSAAFSRN